MSITNQTDILREISSTIGRYTLVTIWKNDVFMSASLTNDHIDGEGGEVIKIYSLGDLLNLMCAVDLVDKELVKSGYVSK